MPEITPQDKPVILVTGFASSRTRGEDPSSTLLRLLGEAPPECAFVRTQILPRDPDGALLKAIEAMDRLFPDAVIGVGVCDEGTTLSVERLAVNLDDREPSRPGGRSEAIDAAGPAAYFSTLPVHMIAEKMRAGGVSATISNSAGTAMCNRLFYALLHYVALRGQETWFGRRPPAGLVSRVGFIRLPAARARAARRAEGQAVDLQIALRGLRLAIESVVEFLGTIESPAAQLSPTVE